MTGDCFMGSLRGNRFVVFLFFLGSLAYSQEPKRSDKFSGPPRDPPSRDFDFLHLRLEVSFDWESDGVEGTATHTVRAFRDGARALELDAVNLAVKSATLANGQALTFETMPEKLRVDLGRESKRGEELAFSISYRAVPKSGVYFQKPDKTYPDNPRQVWTQGEAEEARHWIPCFDHPSDKLTTELFITAPRPMIAISNGRLVSTEPRGSDAQVFHWVQEKPHATYLITAVVGEFAVWKAMVGDLPLAAYVQKKFEKLAPLSFDLTPDMVQFFNSKTGVGYPWPKYDQICVFNFSHGGMENTSATTLTEHTLHDERAGLDVDSTGLVAHELAHQWFGDLVTCKDWGDIWLNESFATFFANLYEEHHQGWDEGVYGRYEEGQSYKREDRNEYRRRLSTRSWKSSDDVFDAHAYPKGSRILSMLRYVLGDDGFFVGIKRYLEKHAFEPVESSDFRVAMEEATGTSLGWFFDEWVYSGGHPRYKVGAEYDAKGASVRIDVEQTQKVDDLTPLFRMPLVLSITTPSGKAAHRVWVSEKKQSFTFPSADRPRLIRFDPGDWILKDLDFEKSREELLYQLERDDDVLGRLSAAEGLKKFVADEDVTAALVKRLDAEPFWGVRLTVVSTLLSLKTRNVAQALMARLSIEPKSRVRREIVKGLGETGGPEAISTLRSAVSKDASYFVVSEALRALGKTAGRDARSDAISALERESFQDEIRAAAVDVLAMDETVTGADQVALVKRFMDLSAPGNSVPVRAAALRALGKLGKGSDDALNTLIAALEDSRAMIRFEAIYSLGALGDRRAIPALEARKAKEKEGRRDPIAAITSAISRIDGRTDMKALQEEIRALRAKHEELERRMGGLERERKRMAF
jgi:aminopeptidase N